MKFTEVLAFMFLLAIALIVFALLPDFLQMWAIIAFLLVVLTKGLK